VAADIERARPVQFGSGPNAKRAHYVLWLGLNRSNLDEKDVLTGEIKELNFASAGYLTRVADATTRFAPIVRTTSSGMLVPAESASMMPDADGLLRDYKAGGTPLVLAARVSGDAKSAYPDGPPPPPAPEKKTETDAAKDKSADKAEDKAAKVPTKAPAAKTPAAKAADKKGAPAKTADKKAEDKKVDAEAAKTPPAPSAKAHVAAGKVNVVVIADTDFIQDQFWLEVREFLGQQVAAPTAHNGALVLAALENLTGSDALISLRARGVADRPFDLVNDLRRLAEQRFRRSEQVLTARLKDLQTKLAGVKKGDGEELVLTDKQRKEIEGFQRDYLEVRRELREVKRELRKDIDRLDGILKFVNIAAVPLLIGLAGIGWAYRRRRSTSPPPAAETQQ
jgi:ABC-type uncharacterized transport system involved in gliding motility auxiliary subunit